MSLESSKRKSHAARIPTIPSPRARTETLYFGAGNAKLSSGVLTATFSLPAGYTCPGACDCLAKFDREKRKLVDGPKQKFRCFAASMEAARPSVRISTDRNLRLLKAERTREGMRNLIRLSLPQAFFSHVRVHVSGDFFSEDYFKAWMEAAAMTPDRLFYAYTKSLGFWTANRDIIPENFVLTASRGGKYDALIDKFELREAIVVSHPEIAEAMGIPVDHDDSCARDPGVRKFALNLHGMQPAGSEGAKAIKRMKDEGVRHSYGKK